MSGQSRQSAGPPADGSGGYLPPLDIALSSRGHRPRRRRDCERNSAHAPDVEMRRAKLQCVAVNGESAKSDNRKIGLTGSD
jgi:hypothetical protein